MDNEPLFLLSLYPPDTGARGSVGDNTIVTATDGQNDAQQANCRSRKKTWYERLALETQVALQLEHTD